MQAEPPPASRPLSGGPWIVFGSDWDRHPSTTHHLFSEFLGRDQVVWVETVGLRAPQFTWRDVKRSAQKLMDFVTGRRRRLASLPPGLTVLCPMTLPFTRFRFIRTFNLRQVRRSVGKVTRRLGFQDPTLVVTTPTQCDFVGELGEALSVYYCLDQYALWPSMNSRHVQKMEEELLQRVDAVVAVSELLAERLVPAAKPLKVIRQGVNVTHFARSLPHRPSGRFEVVYFGMIDERLDMELILQLAHALPEALIRLIGPMTLTPRQVVSAENIRIEPAVPYPELPNTLTTADIFILPFSMSHLSVSCSPLKLKEYLACGRPVVATPLPEAEKLAQYVTIARSREAFVEKVQEAAGGGLRLDDARQQEIQDFLAAESWESKARVFLDFVEAQKKQA